MKILQVVDFFYPALAHGGTAKAAYCISKELALLGHEVTVITGDALDRTHRLESGTRDIDGIRVIYLKNLNTRIAWDFKMTILLGLHFYLKNNQDGFDIIHLHNFYSLQNVVASRYALNTGTPYVLQAHGSLTSNSSKQLAKRFILKTSGRKIIENAAKCIAITETESSDYIDSGVSSNRIARLDTGIDYSEFERLPENGAFRKRIGANANDKIILYIGRLHQTKGLDFLVNSFAEVCRSIPEARLILVGPDDGYANQLKRIVGNLGLKNRVIFTGFLDETTKRSALIDADVFATPSYSGFPATFLEACACGIPIVTTTNGDPLDWVQNGVGIVSAYTPKSFAESISMLLNDKALRTKLGEHGRELASSEFNWKRIVKKLESIYMECAL